MKTQNEIEILNRHEKKDFSFADKHVLKMQIDNFKIKSTDKLFDILVNKSLQRQEGNFLKNVYLNLYPSAVKDLKNSEINNFFFAPYEAFLTYKVSMNENCMLSFYFDNYEFVGGAHGITIRKAQTFNFKKRRQVTLWDFFKNKSEARNILINEILKQAENNMQNNPGVYFENYETLIKKNFNPENFYLTPQGIIIFYNQYEIAPYSTGIVEFLIPYSFADFPPIC